MPDLRDPIWQGWGAVFGLVAILVTVVLTVVVVMYQRSRKNLSYEVVSETQLLSVESEVKSRIEILFDGRPVESVRLLVLRLFNSGNTPITPADYVRPVSITFTGTTQILDAAVVATETENLGATVRGEGQVVTLDPVLLNKGDSVTLKFILAQSTGAFAVDGRIIGVKQIMLQNNRTRRIFERFREIWLFALIIISILFSIDLLRTIIMNAIPKLISTP